jgi:hypothetical protein
MWAVWLRVRAGLRQVWQGLVVLAVITALRGAAVLVALARSADPIRTLDVSGPGSVRVTS